MFVRTSKVCIALVLDDRHKGLVSAFTGSSEHQSRHVKLKVPSGGDRMVTEPACGQIDLGPSGLTAYRSFRQDGQSQATDSHVPISRRVGMGDRCHVDFMNGNVGVRLPSIPSDSQSIGKNQSGTSRDHSSSTVVAKEHLGTQINRVERGATPGASALWKNC